MFGAAIFDMDGLLIDSERAIMGLWLRIAGDLGCSLSDAEYLPVVGRTAEDSASILTGVLGREIFMVASERVRDRIASANPAELFPPKPGSRQLLDDLRKRAVPCAAASSTASAEVRRRLGAVGLLRYFKFVIGGDEVSRGKPDPALYRRCTEMLGLEPERCLAFEDSDNGVASAAAAGVRVILVPDLKNPSEASASLSLEVLPSLFTALKRVDTWFPV